MPDPLTRLALLERTVAALATGSRPSEALQSTVLQVDPTTSVVTAFFPGGVQMSEQTGTNYSPSQGLGWLDSAGGGQIREFVTGVFDGTVHLLQLTSAPDANDKSQVNVFCRAAGGAATAIVNLVCTDNAGGVASINIWDSLKRSSFLQLTSLQQLALNAGKATFTGGGAVSVTAIAVNHGLGRTPTAVLGIPAVNGANVWLGDVNESAASSTTQFTVTAHRSDAGTFTAATTYAFYWVAIG